MYAYHVRFHSGHPYVHRASTDALMVMLNALKSYTPEERASVESFLETYVEVIILAVNSKRETNITLMILFETEEEVQRGYDKVL